MTAPRILGSGYLGNDHYAFDGTLAVSMYDLMYHTGDDIKPASSQTDQATEEKNQRLFARNFAGVAEFQKLVTDTDAATHLSVCCDVQAVYDCASSTWENGDLVAVDEAAGGTALENQKLVKVTDSSLAIGYCIRREASATTRVHVRLIAGFSALSKVLANKSPLGPALGSNVETLAGNKTLVLGDAPVQVLDPGGSGRDVTLPAEASSAGLSFIIHNAADGAEVLTIKDDAAGTICTPTQNESATVYCDGTTWRGIVGNNN